MSADRTPIDWANRRDLLRTLRDLADDSVDELVAEFDARQPTIGRSELVGAVMDRASGAEGTSQDELIDAFMGDQPDWRDAGFDEELVLAGQRFFAEHQWTLNLSFLLGSLPMSYCGASGATVLVRTGNFTDEPQRRVFETANLVLELAREGELVPGGRGYLMLRRLRLLHAVVRRVVEQGEWDGIDDGRAVNQLQLLGTLWCFAITSLDVLDRSDIDVTDDDRVAWVHLWNVVGHLLGVVPPEVLGERLLPMEEAEARACFEEIQAEEFHESADGRLLAREARRGRARADAAPLRGPRGRRVDAPLPHRPVGGHARPSSRRRRVGAGRGAMGLAEPGQVGPVAPQAGPPEARRAAPQPHVGAQRPPRR